MINVSCSDDLDARGGGGTALLYLGMAVLSHPLFPRFLNSGEGWSLAGGPAHESLTPVAWRAGTFKSCFTIY